MLGFWGERNVPIASLLWLMEIPTHEVGLVCLASQATETFALAGNICEIIGAY